jgi:glyoxylase-like metal-dependent hydrolase (beta-lactamase superfamily II)
MRFTRRRLLSTGAGLAALSLAPARVWAELALGDAKVTTVSDGSLMLPGDFIFQHMPEAELATVLQEAGVARDRLEPECNVTLYQGGGNTVLFDVGSGPDFMPTAGSVVDSLDAIGVAPDDITHVVFTHAHPDHIWGLLDDFDDPVFANATYMIGRDEWDYWWDPDTVNTIGEARAAFAVGAKRRLEAIEDQIERFDDGQEILPGIAAVASYGHTPGHMSFEIRNGSNAALIAGDAIGNHHVAFRKPDWPSGSDQDAALAAQTRARLFDRLTADDMTLIGFHLPNGGVGRAEQTSDGYRFTQDI